jgi:hypothetical protein
MRKNLSVVLLAALATGCMAPSRLGYIPLSQSWPVTARAQKGPSLSLYCKVSFINYQPPLGECSPIIVKTAEDSGLFSKVYNGATGGDYRAEMTRRTIAEPMNLWAMAGSACTAYLVPFSVDQFTVLTTTLYDAKGKALENVFYSEGYHLTAALWSWPDASEENTVVPLVKTTLAELARRGSLGSKD